MKFEPPIAEIELFDLRDIISASTGEISEDDTPQYSGVTGNNSGGFDYVCGYWDARDNDDWEHCL